MLLSPFGGRVRGRVLLITNKSIKQQIWRDVLKLRTLGILAPDQQLPTLVEICEPSNVAQRSAELVELASFVKFASTKSLTECCQVLSEAHIVVTNVAKLAQHSGKSKLLECLAPDAFSLVICDEAHHGFSERCCCRPVECSAHVCFNPAWRRPSDHVRYAALTSCCGISTESRNCSSARHFSTRRRTLLCSKSEARLFLCSGSVDRVGLFHSFRITYCKFKFV
eukprot:TRINITY_DN240_c0_g1_i5.p1 TRINITY_DN240_c0_g1~~TRINITY_DN240_c0_g1_i5.p1  ORF type:complete len:224 (+),score=0.20 TRINITY_DN240_c0_g1_i5:188-859(+)